MTNRTRRAFLRQSAGAGAALLSSQLAWPLADADVAFGQTATPTPARPPAPLSPTETSTLTAWCETLAPGSRAAGVGSFVNAQLVKPEDDALLMLRYLDWAPPYAAFYRSGITALERASVQITQRPFGMLPQASRATVLARLLGGAAWDGPPFFLFYLATRADAVDVLYGTASGAARIGAPQRLFVPPVRPW